MAVAMVGVLGLAACGNDGDGAAPRSTTAKFSAEASSSPGGLSLKSTAFAEGGNIPERYTCKGSNTPPPLSWSGIPAGTKSVALAISDPDAPKGTFVHWIVMALPPADGSLSSATLPRGAKVEPNSADQAGYTGMCPPAGERHRYVFEVFALTADVTFPAGASPADKVRALRNGSTKSGQLQAHFQG